MKIHLIKNGIVDNTIEIESLALAQSLYSDMICVEAASGTIGDVYSGGEFSKPQADIASLKTTKNLQINEWRGAANQTFFPYLAKTIACDALSRSDIDAVANSISLTGSFPAGFPGAWKTRENTYIVLSTVQSFKDLYAAMAAQGTVNFNRSQSLKSTLASATTQAQIDAIVWA